MQTVTLNNGIDMPILGFGVYRSRRRTPSASSPRPSRSATAISTPPPPTQNEEAVGRAIAASGLPREDLYLMHQPYGDVHGQWRAMEQVYERGAARAIGVSHFHPDRLIDLILHNDI